jgi:hypothetical protein
MHEFGVMLHAAIMPVEGEENAIRYAKRAKNAPAIHESNLTGRN